MDVPEALQSLLVGTETTVIIFFIVVNSFYALLLALAVLEVRRHLRRTRGEHRLLLMAREPPRITIVAPAHDEEHTITDSVRALMGLYYPDLEVIVVDDGSTDGTFEALREVFDLVPVESAGTKRLPTQPVLGSHRSATHPDLLVVRKKNGGKADALNAGLNAATGELVCAVDADTLIEPDALLRMVRPFLEDEAVMAAGGTIRLANAGTVRAGRVVEARVPHRPLQGWQVVEYQRAFLFGRLGLNRLGGNLVISGAFGLFRRDAVLHAGGYATTTVGEDMELVTRMRRTQRAAGRPDKTLFVPDPVAWTEGPASARVLGQQRRRWHRGLAEVVWGNRGLLFNPRYGRLGLVAFPYFAILELLAPVVEAVGLVVLLFGLVLGAFDWSLASAFLLFAYGYGAMLSAATVLMDELAFHKYRRFRDQVRLLLFVLTENLGYRQMTVWWRLQGLADAVTGRGTWGKMERRGFGR